MSAMLLRIIACGAMLIDHIGFQYGITLFRLIGRVAFPVYVYLICNGYRHTANPWRYALRLALFAVISQVPYSLFCYNSLLVPNGNVFVTLLFCLICVWTFDKMLKNRYLRWVAFLPTLLICMLYHFGIVDSDYGIRGILYALVFFFLNKEKKSHRICMAAGMLFAIYYEYIFACLGYLFLPDTHAAWPTLSDWSLCQITSLLALPLIFRYNGQKGQMPRNPAAAKLVQYGFYVFYPLHQMFLWLIRG